MPACPHFPGIKPLPNLPQRGSKPIYNDFEHHHFDDTIRHLAGSSKELLELRALRRFYDEGQRQHDDAQNYRDMTRTNYMAEVERTRRERLQHQREEQEFMRTWNEVNVMQWIHNQEVALARRQLRAKVKRKLARERRAAAQKRKDADVREVRVGLEGFDPEARVLEQPPPEQRPGHRHDVAAALPEEAFRETMKEMKRRKRESAVLQARRDSRRRKFICEDENGQVGV